MECDNDYDGDADVYSDVDGVMYIVIIKVHLMNGFEELTVMLYALKCTYPLNYLILQYCHDVTSVVLYFYTFPCACKAWYHTVMKH